MLYICSRERNIKRIPAFDADSISSIQKMEAIILVIYETQVGYLLSFQDNDEGVHQGVSILLCFASQYLEEGEELVARCLAGKASEFACNIDR